MKNKLGVLLVDDMVLFPNAEIRFDVNTLEDKQIISVAEATEEKEEWETAYSSHHESTVIQITFLYTVNS